MKLTCSCFCWGRWSEALLGSILGSHLGTILRARVAIGAIVGGCLGAWLFFEVLAPKAVPAISDLAVWKWLVYAIVLTITGMLGDLAESLIKRDMQTKDSSSWLPGLGGILDVMDSITLSAVPAYLCWVSGLIS